MLPGRCFSAAIHAPGIALRPHEPYHGRERHCDHEHLNIEAYLAEVPVGFLITKSLDDILQREMTVDYRA